MIRRTLVIALLLALLAPAAAVAQNGGPFSPLPPAQPTPTSAPKPTNSNSSDLGGRNTLYILGLGLFVVFIGIGVFISRDARRSLPADHRPDHRLREEGPHQHKRQAKAKSRQRARAQKAARRRNR
jgi:hypothetical protein